MDDIILVNEALRRIGKNADAAGTATLFAQLARIYSAVDQVEGYTDTLETLLGLTGDVASGTGNVLQRLAAIRDYVDTLESTVGTINTNVNTANTNINTSNTNINAVKAKTDLIGLAADAAGAATIFAQLNRIYGAVDQVEVFTDSIESTLGVSTDTGTASIFGNTATIRGVLGTNADAPATNASIWAMLKSLNAKSGGTDLFALTPNIQRMATESPAATATGYFNMLTVTGSGILGKASLACQSSGHAACYVVDGVEYTMHDYRGDVPASMGLWLAGNYQFSSTLSTGPFVHEITSPIRFNSSFIVRIRNIANGANAPSGRMAAELITHMK